MSRAAFRFLVATLATLMALSWVTLRPQPARAAGTGSVSLAGTGAVTQDFDTLANTGTANTTLPTGWFLSETGTSSANNDAYNTGTGSGTAGDTYSFGAASSTERAFGGLLSGTLTPIVGAQFTNNTGFAITSVAIAYNGEGWRLGADPLSGTPTARGADRLDFQVSTNATSLSTGTWIDVDSLDFVSPLSGTAGARDGNAAANRTAISGNVGGMNLSNGASFWIRWNEFNPASSDDGLAVDDFSITPTVDDSINLSIADVSQNEGNSGSAAMNFTVSLSNPAGAGGVSFDIATTDDSATILDNDYVAASVPGETIPEGQSSVTFTVAIQGDTDVEANEQFFVNVSNVTGVDSVTDGQAIGTILNDDTDPCAQAFTPIYSIQGSGASAAITGNVTTQGVVVADIEGAAAGSGFYLQDATGDGDAATSDGIFVFTGASNLVNAGDVVRVTGFARERFNQTAINGSNSNTAAVTQVLNCGTGTVAATDVTMPFASLTFPERYEGMLVRFPQNLVIAEYFNYDRFGEIVLALPWLSGETRHFTGTAIDEPGAAANARTAANLLRRIILDDNQSAENPPSLRHPNGQPFALDNSFRGGDHAQNAVGALGFDFSRYRIFPTAAADYTASNPRPETPEELEGGLRVAAMNTLNFFLTIDTTRSDSGGGPCGGNANLDCRGADNDVPDDDQHGFELERQRTKLLAALAGLDADVLGLNELENTPNVNPLGGPGGIVEGLNEIFGAGTYADIDTGTIGTDAIKVGIIYRPGIVKPIGTYEVLDSTDDPRFIDTRSRPALAQTFEEIATGARFTVVVNHLKSKGSSCADIGDPDISDGQGNCNLTRKAAAEALVDWLATDPTGSNDPDFLIMGDLNSYAMEDPIDAVKAGPDGMAGNGDDYTNLIAQYQGTYAYSYTFDGQAGYLDHALANATLAPQVKGAVDWHINSDEPDILDYDVTFKPAAQENLYETNQYRTSDHDPVIVGLDLVNVAPTIEVSAGLSCSTDVDGGTFQLAVDDPEQGAAALTLSLEGNTNTTLVPNAHVTFGGTGATRSVAITAADKQSGTAVLTIGVSDGWSTTTVTINVRVGTDANDSFTGTGGADLLVGGQGSDVLSGLDGADVLCGGHGTDTLFGGGGNDALEGDRGSDILAGGEGNDILHGGQGADALAGDGGDDTLTGGPGGDAFSGGAGTDSNTDFSPGQGDTTDST